MNYQMYILSTNITPNLKYTLNQYFCIPTCYKSYYQKKYFDKNTNYHPILPYNNVRK